MSAAALKQELAKLAVKASLQNMGMRKAKAEEAAAKDQSGLHRLEGPWLVPNMIQIKNGSCEAWDVAMDGLMIPLIAIISKADSDRPRRW